MQQATGELHGVRHARQQVSQQSQQLQLQLAEVSACLERAVPHSERGRTEPLVTPKDIDDVFAALWQIRSDADEGQLCRTLVASVSRVTLAGLAKITAAQPPRLEVIASQIASGCAVAIAGPPWGGKRRVMGGLKFYVIPPVAPETGEKLRQMISEHEPGRVVVAIADEMPASINGLTLYIHSVNDIGEDLLTQWIRRGLKDAIEDPNNEMYVPDGFEAWDRLGISVNGEVQCPANHSDKKGASHA
jgi:hypothetical protein